MRCDLLIFSYFHPPSRMGTIIVYYNRENPDFAAPLFLLFHESGHYVQYLKYMESGREQAYWKNLNTPTGEIKADFEKEGWILGRELLEQFIARRKLNPSLLKDYDRYAGKNTKSYH